VLLSLSLSKMLTVAEINTLVAEICTLANALPLSVPNGSKDDKIWAVMNSDDGETPHETFNKRFDAMFGEDCRDVHGRLHHIHRGKIGMGLVCSYLTNLDWTDFPLDLAEIKLQRLLAELKQLQCVFNPFLSLYANELLALLLMIGSHCDHDQHATQTQHQNSETRTMLRRPTCHSNVKQSKNFTPAMQP
jgi:hypothetical protein